MIAAVLNGPSYEASSHDESTIEVFTHIGEVIDALYERMHSNGRYPCTVRTLDGKYSSAVFPTFGEGMRFTCFQASAMSRLSKENPEVITEDIVMELLPAVHGGHWDYDMELVQGPEDLIFVQVERNGMS